MVGGDTDHGKFMVGETPTMATPTMAIPTITFGPWQPKEKTIKKGIGS